MPGGTSRVYLANLVNAVMIDHPPARYARTMAAVTPRKLWLARPGDCVVTLAPCTDGFRQYVASVTGTPAESIDVVAPDAVTPTSPADIIDAHNALQRVKSHDVLVPFVLDAPTMELANRAGLAIHPYGRHPEPETLRTVRAMNTKSGFRAIAAGLGLPVVDGGHSATPAALVADLATFLRAHPRAIVKVDRSSNGHGTFVCGGGDDIERQVAQSVADAPGRRCGWVYEAFLAFEAVPSIELFVDDRGVHDFYTCDQRTRDNAWTGMVTPASASPGLSLLIDAAIRIGRWLYYSGFRGYFDVDGGIFHGGYVVTEANVRRTGGTYLELLARRLTPAGTATHWRADVRTGGSRLDFAGAVRALERVNLADPAAAACALLTADTLAVDGKWRYLILGRSAAEVADAELTVSDVLGLD